MRRLLFVIGCLLFLFALTPRAEAQLNPRGFLNVLTSPLRGFGRIARPRFKHHGPRRAARRAPPAAGAAAIATAPAATEAKPDPKTETALKLPEAPAAFWPGAHEELIGYVFWPGKYDDRIWGHGFADIANAILAPRPVRTTDASATPSETVNAAKVCGDENNSGLDDHVGKMIADSAGETTLTDTQRAALGDLDRAIADAIKSARSACAAIVNAEPTARVQTMLERLWSVRVAGYLVREPLAKFYATLTREQRAKFERPQDSADTFGMCSAASAQRLPFTQLEKTIRPTGEQRAAFGNLQRRFEQAALSLRASCPGKPPATPVARLDAALDRIDAITYAAGSLAPTFGEFYAGLNEDQRTRLAQFGR
jgi:hypothetical protein